MSFWGIFLLIVGILTLILVLPAGVKVLYNGDGFHLSILYGPIRISLLPGKKKTTQKKKKEKKKPAASAKKKEAPPKKEPAQKGGGLSGLMEYVPIVRDLLDGIRTRLLVRNMILYVNLAGDDPCDLALLYGKATAAVGCAIPLLEQVFRIRKRDVQIFCDFTAEKTEIYLDMSIVTCPARMIWLVLRQGIRFLRIFMKQKTAKAV